MCNSKPSDQVDISKPTIDNASEKPVLEVAGISLTSPPKMNFAEAECSQSSDEVVTNDSVGTDQMDKLILFTDLNKTPDKSKMLKDTANATESNHRSSLGLFLLAIIIFLISVAILTKDSNSKGWTLAPEEKHVFKTNKRSVRSAVGLLNAISARQPQPTILKAQLLLKAMGYMSSECDGVYGPMTAAAFERYESDYQTLWQGEITSATNKSMKKHFLKSEEYHSSLRETLPLFATVEVSAKLFAQPHPLSDAINHIKSGSQVKIIGSGDAGYFQTSFEGQIGYINFRWLDNRTKSSLDIYTKF